MRFTYTTVNFNSAGETSLQIVRQTGIFEKKYKSTTVKYNMQYFDSISLFKDDIANQVADILNSKRNFSWEKYDIHKLKYQHNVSVFRGRTMFYSNIDESTMADIIKPTVPGKSIINLNSLDKYTLLVDQYYNKAEDRRNYLIHTKIYSENGNMFTEIIKKAASPFAAEIWECIANNQITLQETAKKDIAIVSNTARLITIKRED